MPRMEEEGVLILLDKKGDEIRINGEDSLKNYLKDLKKHMEFLKHATSNYLFKYHANDIINLDKIAKDINSDEFKNYINRIVSDDNNRDSLMKKVDKIYNNITFIKSEVIPFYLDLDEYIHDWGYNMKEFIKHKLKQTYIDAYINANGLDSYRSICNLEGFEDLRAKIDDEIKFLNHKISYMEKELGISESLVCDIARIEKLTEELYEKNDIFKSSYIDELKEDITRLKDNVEASYENKKDCNRSDTWQGHKEHFVQKLDMLYNKLVMKEIERLLESASVSVYFCDKLNSARKKINELTKRNEKLKDAEINDFLGKSRRRVESIIKYYKQKIEYLHKRMNDEIENLCEIIRDDKIDAIKSNIENLYKRRDNSDVCLDLTDLLKEIYVNLDDMFNIKYTKKGIIDLSDRNAKLAEIDASWQSNKIKNEVDNTVNFFKKILEDFKRNIENNLHKRIDNEMDAIEEAIKSNIKRHHEVNLDDIFKLRYFLRRDMMALSDYNAKLAEIDASWHNKVKNKFDFFEERIDALDIIAAMLDQGDKELAITKFDELCALRTIENLHKRIDNKIDAIEDAIKSNIERNHEVIFKQTHFLRKDIMALLSDCNAKLAEIDAIWHNKVKKKFDLFEERIKALEIIIAMLDHGDKELAITKFDELCALRTRMIEQFSNAAKKAKEAKSNLSSSEDEPSKSSSSHDSTNVRRSRSSSVSVEERTPMTEQLSDVFRRIEAAEVKRNLSPSKGLSKDEPSKSTPPSNGRDDDKSMGI